MRSSRVIQKLHQTVIQSKSSQQKKGIEQNNNNDYSVDKFPVFNKKIIDEKTSPQSFSFKHSLVNIDGKNQCYDMTKRLSMYHKQKTQNLKQKQNSISIANISVYDERSTDIQEEQSQNNSIMTPYKTSSTFQYKAIPKAKLTTSNQIFQQEQIKELSSDRLNHSNMKIEKKYFNQSYKNENKNSNSNSELPEIIKLSNITNRIKNNQSISVPRVQQCNVSSVTQSKTQFIEIIGKQSEKERIRQVQQRLTTIQRLNHDFRGSSPISKRQHSSVSLPATNSLNNHQIRIEINKEESVVNHLTKEHKQNMSLLYYDFNNANQRIQAKQKQNLADLIIPEENEDQIVNVYGQVNNSQEESLQMPIIEEKKSRQNLITDPYSVTSSEPNNTLKINQKIDKARKKISDFIKQSSSGQHSSLKAKQQTSNNNQMSLDMVRLGSPFLGTQFTSSAGQQSPTFNSIKYQEAKKQQKSFHNGSSAQQKQSIANFSLNENINKRNNALDINQEFSFKGSQKQNNSYSSGTFYEEKQQSDLQCKMRLQRKSTVEFVQENDMIWS